MFRPYNSNHREIAGHDCLIKSCSDDRILTLKQASLTMTVNLKKGNLYEAVWHIFDIKHFNDNGYCSHIGAGRDSGIGSN
jgi:hypothetical protein